MLLLLMTGLACSADRGAATGTAEEAWLDPSRLAPGDSVAGLQVEYVDARPETVDSFGWSGRVRFSGEIALNGTYRPHPEFPDVRVVCFHPDSVTAAKLPRFPNDERFSWLCFTNQQEAARQLGLAVGDTALVIDEFEYVYEHTDSYNTARLVRVAPSPGSRHQ